MENKKEEKVEPTRTQMDNIIFGTDYAAEGSVLQSVIVMMRGDTVLYVFGVKPNTVEETAQMIRRLYKKYPPVDISKLLEKEG